MKEKKNHLLIAQMTRHASFGPILLTSTQPNPMRHCKRLVEPKKKKKN